MDTNNFVWNEFQFTLINTLVCILLFLGFVAICLRVQRTLKKSSLSGNGDIIMAMWKHKSVISVWALCFVAGAIYLSLESSAIRPRTVLKADDSKQRERLREIDNAPPPVINEVKKPETFEEQQARNRASNEATKKEFDKLPDAGN